MYELKIGQRLFVLFAVLTLVGLVLASHGGDAQATLRTLLTILG